MIILFHLGTSTYTYFDPFRLATKLMLGWELGS